MVLVAFALRLTLIFVQHPYQLSDPVHHFQFGGETGSIARSVAEGEGFSSPFTGSTGPTAWIGPVYVYMCAAVFKVFGVFTSASRVAILSLNSLASALTCLVIYFIGLRMGSRTLGVTAGWLWAILPQFMHLCTTWIWETSFSALLLALTILFAIRLAENCTWKAWAGFGVFWGFCTLMNPALLPVFPISLAWIAMKRRATGLRYTGGLAIGILLCSITVMPWLVRNRVVFGHWVFIRSNFAFELYLDNHPMPNEGSFFLEHPTANPAQYKRYTEMGELAFVDYHKAKALDFIKGNPKKFIARTGARIIDFWTGGILVYLLSFNKPPLDLQALFILPMFMLPGIVIAAVKRIRYWGFMVAVMLAYPLPYYVTFPSMRYRHPIEPLMLLMATYFCVESARVLKQITRSKQNNEEVATVTVHDLTAINP